uniref:Uncharacterized protein n=1 Tax=Alexandrium monilatum TaxID=311494 RepID=A0A7S4Q3N6_9DINO
MAKAASVAALRVAVGQLSPRTTQALSVALHQPSRSSAWAAVCLAASWLPAGTPEALALAAAAGRLRRQSRPESAAEGGSGPREGGRHALPGDRALRADAPARPHVERPRIAAAALGVAAKQLDREMAALLAAAIGSFRCFADADLPEKHGCGWIRCSAARSAAAAKASSAAGPHTAASLGFYSRPWQFLRQVPSQGYLHVRGQSAVGLDEARRGWAGASSPSLCHDTSVRVMETLWPHAADVPVASPGGGPPPASLTPRTFESRLRHSAPLLQDLQQVSAVSPVWARHADQGGWPAAHAYLYQELGTKDQLRQRYSDSMRQLLLKDWILRAGHAQAGAESLVSRIIAFMP